MQLEGPLFAHLQIGVSVVSILLQCITFPVLLAHTEFRAWISYRLMLAISCFDLLQLVPNLLFQIFFVTGFKYGRFLEEFCGASFTIAWDCLVFCQLLLAANRLLAVLKSIYSPTATDYTPRAETLTFNTMLAFVWAYFFAVVALFMTPWAGTKFLTKDLQFYYDFSLPLSVFYQNFELYATTASAGVCIALYLVIVALLKMKRKPPPGGTGNGAQQIQQSNHSRSNGGAVRLVGPLSVQEFRVLVQSAVLFVLMLFLTFCWYLGDGWLPPVFFQLHLPTFLFLVYCGLNPVFLIVLNAHFRGKLKAFYGRCFFCSHLLPSENAPVTNLQLQQVRVGGRGRGPPPGPSAIGIENDSAAKTFQNGKSIGKAIFLAAYKSALPPVGVSATANTFFVHGNRAQENNRNLASSVVIIQ